MAAGGCVFTSQYVPTSAASYRPPRGATTTVSCACSPPSDQQTTPTTQTTPFIRVLVIAGEPYVGKSALCVQYVQQRFLAEYDPSLDDVWRKYITIDDIPCCVEIHNAAPLYEEYTLMQDRYIEATPGFVIVYSITSSISFNQVRPLYDRIAGLKAKTGSAFACVIVGNKVDLEPQRQVTVEQGVSLATSLNLPFFETCAKTRLQVDDVFEEVTRGVLHLGLDPKQLMPPTIPSSSQKCSLM
ncbi:ras protein let-60 [Pelomyxa schiedti]|nr:ras protein let-60 [Pelomyxa schiedti]